MNGKIVHAYCPKCGVDLVGELGVTQYYKFRANDGKVYDVRIDNCDNCGCRFAINDDGFCIILLDNNILEPSNVVCY